MAINGTTILQLPIASGITADQTWVAVAVFDGQSWTSKRVAADTVGNTGSFVPTSRAINTGPGISGGGTLASDLTLAFAPSELSLKSAMVTADSFAIVNSEMSDDPYRVTFPNAMKAIAGLSASGALNLTADKLVVVKASDGQAYSTTASEIALAAGNMPAGGTTGQTLIKASDADYDTEWSTGGFLDQPAGYFFGGPASGPDAPPAFRLLAGTDLPNPGASSKGGARSRRRPHRPRRRYCRRRRSRRRRRPHRSRPRRRHSRRPWRWSRRRRRPGRRLRLCVSLAHQPRSCRPQRPYRPQQPCLRRRQRCQPEPPRCRRPHRRPSSL